MKRERLRIENIKKGNFLNRIHLQMYEGEIVHVIFDNVQERDMLLDILTGVQTADFGKIYYEEEKVPENAQAETYQAIASVISKDSTLIASVSILENIFLMRSHVPGQVVQTREYEKRAEALFDEFQIETDIHRDINTLSVFEKVRIEMMKAYLLEKKIIIFTGLGNVLGDVERIKLLDIFIQLKEKGLTIIVAEPLENISFSRTDRVVIIKNGKTVISKDVQECDYLMLKKVLYSNGVAGEGKRDFFSKTEACGEGFHIMNLSTPFLRDISLSVGKGEILKVYCEDEQSYEEFAGVFTKEAPVVSGFFQAGEVRREIGRTNRGIKDGIGVLEGNPVSATLFTELTAMDNLQMLLSRKAGGIFAQAKYKRSIMLVFKDVIGEEVYAKRVKDLSSAEIQKIAYGRWLIFSPDLLVCIQPFADGDVKGREAAREMIYLIERRKIPILIITSNSLEFNYCRGNKAYIRNGKLVEKEEPE